MSYTYVRHAASVRIILLLLCSSGSRGQYEQYYIACFLPGQQRRWCPHSHDTLHVRTECILYYIVYNTRTYKRKNTRLNIFHVVAKEGFIHRTPLRTHTRGNESTRGWVCVRFPIIKRPPRGDIYIYIPWAKHTHETRILHYCYIYRSAEAISTVQLSSRWQSDMIIYNIIRYI